MARSNCTGAADVRVQRASASLLTSTQGPRLPGLFLGASGGPPRLRAFGRLSAAVPVRIGRAAVAFVGLTDGSPSPQTLGDLVERLCQSDRRAPAPAVGAVGEHPAGPRL